MLGTEDEVDEMLVAVARGDLSFVDIETWYRARLGRARPGGRRTSRATR